MRHSHPWMGGGNVKGRSIGRDRNVIAKCLTLIRPSWLALPSLPVISSG